MKQIFWWPSWRRTISPEYTIFVGIYHDCTYFCTLSSWFPVEHIAAEMRNSALVCPVRKTWFLDNLMIRESSSSLAVEPCIEGRYKGSKEEGWLDLRSLTNRGDCLFTAEIYAPETSRFSLLFQYCFRMRIYTLDRLWEIAVEEPDSIREVSLEIAPWHSQSGFQNFKTLGSYCIFTDPDIARIQISLSVFETWMRYESRRLCRKITLELKKI